MRRILKNSKRIERHRFLLVEQLEARSMLSAAHDIMSLTALRADPAFGAIDGRLPSGERIGVAVIDSGVFASHVDLRDRFLVYYDAVARTPASTNISAARDPHGHGTHTAGLVLGGFSATLNDTVGVAPQAGLVAVRGLPSGSESFPQHDTVLESLNWVLANYAQYNIKVVNMSLGVYTTNFNSQPADNDQARVIQALENVGVTVVTASGNEFAHFNQLGQSAPAVFSSLSVGNMLPESGQPYGLSGYNPWAGFDNSPTSGTFDVTSQRSTMSNQVVAPGHGTISTYNNGQYQTGGGTSAASPHVAGLVALMQDAAMTFGGRYLTVEEVVNIVRTTADTLNDQPDSDTYRCPMVNRQADCSRRQDLTETGQSFKRVNAQRAVQAVRTLVSQGGGGGGGGGGSDTDTNNVIDRAVLLPPLNGQDTFSFDGRIGQDGQVTVGNNDVDLFKLALETPGQLNFLAQALPGGIPFDAYLRVFNSTGNQIAFNDDANAGNQYPALTTGSLPAGTYYVGLSSFNNGAYDIVNGSGSQNGGSSGDYRVTITTLNFDPNGVIQGAVPIDLTSPDFVWPTGSPAVAAGIFVANKVGSFIGSDPHPLHADDPARFPERIEMGPTDVDMFKITAPDTGHLFIDVEALSVYGALAVDSFVRVYRLEANGSATTVGENDDDGVSQDSFLAVNVEIGRTYFVALTTFGNSNFNPFDPSGRSSFTNQTGFMDAYFSFFNGDVNGTAYSNVSLNDNPSGINGIGTFPGTIGSDFGAPLLGANSGFKDVDFLRITVAQSGALQVAVSSPNGTLNPALGIWQLSPTGSDIVQVMTEASQNPVALFQVTAGQTFWISITGHGNGGFNWSAPGSGTGGDTGDYQLTTSFLTQSQFQDATNNSVQFDTPTAIGVGQSIDESIGDDGNAVVGLADVDIFIFQPSVTQTVEIFAGGQSSEKADVMLRLFDSAGNELAFNDNVSNTTTDAFLSVLVQAGQTYYIGVNGASNSARSYNPLTGAGAAPGSQGSYTLTVLGDAAPPTSINQTLRKNGSNVELVNDIEQVIFSQALTSSAPIVVNGPATEGGSFTLDFAFGGVFSVVGGVTYNGGALGDDEVIVVGNVNVTLSNTNITVPLAGKSIKINNVARAVLIGGAGNNRLDATRFTGSVVIVGGEGNDTLIGGAGGDTFVLGPGVKTVWGNGGFDVVVGSVGGLVTLTNTKLTSAGNSATLNKVEFADLTGSPGNDVFNVTGWTRQARLQGEDGVDKLVSANNLNMTLTDDFLDKSVGGLITLSSFESATLAGGWKRNILNAAAFSGFTLLSGFAGNDSLRASLGGSILLGGAGNDALHGNIERDLLFAGAGANFLSGGEGEDMLFGGATSLDTNDAKLQALFAFWSSELDFQARVFALRNGTTGIARFPRLDAKFLKADKLADSLFGDAEADWFFAKPVSNVNDFVNLVDVATPPQP